MKDIIRFLKLYFREVNKPILIFCTFFTAVLIWLNYHDGLEKYLVRKMNLPWPSFTGHLILFLFAFLIPHALLFFNKKKMKEAPAGLIACAVAAPAIFALKMAMNTELKLSAEDSWNSYWNHILYWPLRVGVLTLILLLAWKLYQPKESFYGMTIKKFNVRPYL